MKENKKINQEDMKSINDEKLEKVTGGNLQHIIDKGKNNPDSEAQTQGLIPIPYYLEEAKKEDKLYISQLGVERPDNSQKR